MEKKRLRSTVFHSGRCLSKHEQERLVGELFKEGYEQATGIRVEGNDPGGDPPDRLFSYRNLSIGVEMFELGQFYKARALFEDLTDEIYSEFERRGACKRYEGIVINVGILKDIKTAGALITRLQQKSTRGKPKPAFAEEFVDLFVGKVPSRDAVPKDRRVIGVDPGLYPAVSALTKEVVIHRCPINTVLRTDGKAAPLVIMSPGYRISDGEIEESMKNKMLEKIEGNQNWKSAVEHSVLVAHDVPRGQMYEGFASRAGAHEWLKSAASRVDLLETFDELWFVTPFESEVDVGGKTIRAKAQRICGRGLEQHSG